MAPRSRRGVLGGIALVAMVGCMGDDDGGDDAGDDDVEWTGPSIGDQELSNAYPVRLDDADTGEEVVNVHYHGEGEGGWHYQPLEVPLDVTRQLTIRLMDADDEALPLDGYEIETSVGDTELLEAEVQDGALDLTGRATGELDLTLTFRNDEASWTTPPVEVAVED